MSTTHWTILIVVAVGAALSRPGNAEAVGRTRCGLFHQNF